LREHQIPPPHRPLPTTRVTSLPGRVETDRRHPQPPQTLARDPGPSTRLTPPPSIPRTESASPRRTLPPNAFARSPRRLWATSSNQVVPLVGGDGADLARDHQPRNPCERACDGEDGDADAVALDARRARRLEVAADRVDRAAGAVVA